MPYHNQVETIWGAALVEPVRDKKDELFQTLLKYNVTRIDTANLYGTSETILGELGAPNQFIVDTKAPVLGNQPHSRDSIIKSINQSFQSLKTDHVDVYYLHSPNYETPISEQLETLNELYNKGYFKKLGLSNFSADQVQEVYDYAKEHGLVLPSVYQSNYNPVARLNETDLFPLLRKLNFQIYAYSPLAGGFLVKSVEQLKSKSSRWNKGDLTGNLYNSLYNKPELLEALEDWDKISQDTNIQKAELAYRWVKFNSALQSGDGIIIGSSNIEQLDQTLSWLEKGPLEQATVDRIDAFWKKFQHAAPRDNFASTNFWEETK